MNRSVLRIAFLAGLCALTAGCLKHPAPTPATQPTGRGQIDSSRLLAADPADWLTTGRDFGKSHFSPLNQINRETASRLGFAWEYRTGTRRGLEATPIVVDGIVYATGEFGRVFAVDARTGKEVWTFDPKVDGQELRKACCDAVNRGVAVWKGKVYTAAVDGRLIALDAATGKVLWQADTVIDHERAYTSTGAPEVAGKDGRDRQRRRGIRRARLCRAWDLETGEFRWRFYTVPGDPAKALRASGTGTGRARPGIGTAAGTWAAAARRGMRSSTTRR